MNKIARGFLAAIGASIIVVCVAVVLSQSMSANKGNIHAVIIDSVSGEKLNRATIQILETKQGALAKPNGEATVKNILPGAYTVVAKYAGYYPMTIKNVVVDSGKTTELTFRLTAKKADTIIIATKKSIDETQVVKVDPETINSGFSIHGSRGTDNSVRINNIDAGAVSGDVLAPSFGMSEVGTVTSGNGAASAKRKSMGFGGFSDGEYYAPPPPMPNYSTAEYKKIDENEYKAVSQEPLSTFSIDVDGASYSNVRHFITSGQTPPKDAVRIEEMVNYFKYNYPQPKNSDPFSITTEMEDCPWNSSHKLALIGLQGKEIPKADAPPANLTFLLDVSGSMEPQDRLPLLQRAFRLLVNELRPEDKVSIVVYAGSAGVVLPPTSGKNKETILAALDRLHAGGSTAGGAGLKLAYATAEENFDKEKNNRVILATDGDFNIGISNTADLTRYIEEKRATGIYLTMIGVGTDNYKDNRMKELADKGNGNYYYIDNILEAKKVFVTQMGGTLNAIAKDVKIHIEFNPAYISGYRLIGYESRILAKEDFNNDKKDAGELGSGHTVTALYEIIPVGTKADELQSVDSLRYQQTVTPKMNFGGDEMMMVKFRYKRPADSTSLLIKHPHMAEGISNGNPRIRILPGNLRWAAAVAEFGMLVRDSKFKGTANTANVLALAKSAKGSDDEGYRAEFIKLIEAYQLMDKASK